MKFPVSNCRTNKRASSPARGTWIEIARSPRLRGRAQSSPARGTWIEMSALLSASMRRARSSPARGTWIEIAQAIRLPGLK